MDNEEEQIYHYYTIVDEGDTFITGVDENELKYIENVDEEDENKIMYLSLNQEDIYATETALDEEVKNEDDIHNVEFITVEDGQVYATDSSNLDEAFTTIDTDLITSTTADAILLKEENEEIDKDDNFESDYRRVKFEDGTCALINKSLFDSLTKSIAEDEDAVPIPQPKKVKKYKCTYFGCNKTYSSSNHLTVHVRNHTGSRPYQCNIPGCEKAFATGYSLKAHYRTHTGEAPYSCSACPKQFKTSGDLQKHVRTHTGEKPFRCPIEGCGRSFTTSNIRKVHIRSHTGERPYACDHPGCGKAFASATNFKNHRRIHSGEKPYECSVPGCGKRFTEYSSLFKHNTVHKPFKPLKCEFCDKLCKHETTLKAHKQAMHKILITEDGKEVRLTKEKSGNYFMATTL